MFEKCRPAFCVLFLILSFFSVYVSSVRGEEVNTEENEQSYDASLDVEEVEKIRLSGEKQTNNLNVKTSEGGTVTVVDYENEYLVELEFNKQYPINTQLKIEVVPNYNHYIDSIIINGEIRDGYNTENIYELISDIYITEEATTIEVIFGENTKASPIADGDTVEITKGTKYEYGGYYTNEYWIHADGYQFLGSCAEPVKEGPDGEKFTATKITDPIFRYLMWCYQNDEFREEAFGSVERELQFVLLHTTLGYYYCGEQGFGELENAGKYWMNKADDVLNWVRKVFYGSEEVRYVNARTAARTMFDIYIAWGGDYYQDIVWIQPKDVDLIITKKSTSDFESGERKLTGATFGLYAWNGTSYVKKVAESVDNGDGTYGFAKINYMDAIDGKFLVKEENAPKGYCKPYYFYNSGDSSDYNTYGGREFVLDKSYLSWSCESAEKGFVFYNNPEEKSITITKIDADTGEKLTGAVFELYAYGEGGYTYRVGEFTDNGNGTYSISFCFDVAKKDVNGEYTYLVKECKAPQGYVATNAEKIVSYTVNGSLKTIDSELVFENKAHTGKLQINKNSANPELTNKNTCYSLENAEYTVYSDSACTIRVGVLKTNEEGVSNIISLQTGTYYVKETKEPKGYEKDMKTYTVTLTSEHAITEYVLDVVDGVEMKMIDVLLQKVDADTKMSKPQGFGTLDGAEFTVKYYATEGMKDPEKEGMNPTRTWVFVTSEEGVARYQETFLLKGDALYRNSQGIPSLPYGVITIQETKASEGYMLNDTIYVIPISEKESEGEISDYRIPTIPEKVRKLELTKKESGTNMTIPSAVFEYIRPDGNKEKLVTDSDGKIFIKGLEYGTHSIKEVSVMDGYYVNSNEIKFSLGEDDEIKVLSKNVISDVDGEITIDVNSEGNIEVNVDDKQVPYSVQIVKMNDKGIGLEGAELTIYADKNCTKVVLVNTTDSNGMIKFSGLKYGTTYYLKETKAPKGYRLSKDLKIYEIKGETSPVNEKWNFEVNHTQYSIKDADVSDEIYVSGTATERIINLKIVNNIGLLLPETGSAMTIICFVIGATMMSGILITNVRKKKLS